MDFWFSGYSAVNNLIAKSRQLYALKKAVRKGRWPRFRIIFTLI